jgi:alcohol dehydrogenase
MRRLMAMIATNRVDLTPLVTHHFALDNISEAYDLFSHQRDGVLKVALHPGSAYAATQVEQTVAAGVDEQC